MIIILFDEPGLFVFPSVEAAVLDIEAIDAESEIRAAFDDSAVPYRAEWIRPNEHESMFGLLRTIRPGAYTLVPAGPPDPSALIALLEKHLVYTESAEYERPLASLLARLRRDAP